MRRLWRETPIPGIAAMVLCVIGTGYLILTGNSPAEVTVAQATAVAPILIVLLALAGHSLVRRWTEARAVKEIRRNQQRRTS